MTVTLAIDALGGGGVGVAHHDGEVWMVAGALPGETVTAVASGRRAGVVRAHTATVVAGRHPARAADPAPPGATCGGCDWSHVDPEAGAPLKAAVAAGAARAHPELAACLAAAPVRSSPSGYRLRARLHWQPDIGALGFYRPRSWRVVAAQSCRCGMLSARLAAGLPGLAAALAESCPQPVDLEWVEDLAGETAVAALRPARGGPVPQPRWLPTAATTGAVDGFHLLSSAGRLSTGWGATGVTMSLPVPLEVPVGAFFQGNRHLVPWLFDRVASLVDDRPEPTWDLHAGVGFLAAAAWHAAHRPLLLVEPYRPAARAAARNLPDGRTVGGRTAEAYLARHHRLPAAALVLTDPPRAGLSADLRRRLAGWHPRRILMLACDPATWARDAVALLACGYSLGHLELVDLFPATHHVEVLAMLVAA